MGGKTNWLYKAFSVDREQWELSVMALFNRSEPVCWELMALEDTANWRHYVTRACQTSVLMVLLVQFLSKVQVNKEAEDWDGDEGEGESGHQGEGEDGEEEEEDGGEEEEQEVEGGVVLEDERTFEGAEVVDEGEV
jgi:hypothetical protein